MKLGVVIPTLDEADAVEAALQSIVGQGPGDGVSESAGHGSIREEPVEIEIVVVDGGSVDDTCQRARSWRSGMTVEAPFAARAEPDPTRSLAVSRPSAARPCGARVLELPRQPHAGRARQLQAGFEACDGDAVLFLHADTRLPEGWPAAVCRALADPGVVGGAFRFRFDRVGRPSFGLRVVEWGARLRSAWFGLPYGDQAIFVRRRVLDAIGGVPQAVLMEDLDLVRAMKRRGRLARLAAPATTSSRRYREQGVLRTFLRNLVALVAWRLGVDRGRVAAWYRS